MNIKEASKYSIHNVEELRRSKIAGCYYCLSIFETSAIIDFCDDGKTALCPTCGIDSVLPDSSPYEINIESMKSLNSYWFDGTS